MNRNSRFVLVLTVALAAAGAASFIVYRVVASIPVREVEVASHNAVVAAMPIPVGTIVTKDHLKVVPWPARNLVPGSFISRSLASNEVMSRFRSRMTLPSGVIPPCDCTCR